MSSAYKRTLPRRPSLPPGQVSEHPECRIKLTVLKESSGKGKAAGHKVKLTAALVLAGTTTEGLSKPGRCAAGGRAGKGAGIARLQTRMLLACWVACLTNVLREQRAL